MRLLKTAYFSVNSSGNALRKTLKSAALLCLCLSFLLVFSCYKRPVSLAPSSPPHNVIFLIGDGMGPVHVEAARLYTGEPLSFENLPYQGRVKTYSANNSVTDSAAAGTALATGVKVNNSVIGMKIPGEQQELLNLSEWAKSQGKSTGLVTSAHMTDATPAAFGAHEPKRTNYAQIACDYLQQSRPNVLFGGGGNFSEFVDPTRAGYSVVRNRAELNAFHPTTPDFFVSGAFGDGSDGMPYEYEGEKEYTVLPHLSELTSKALSLLDDDPDGFFLMVEGAKIDKACHANNLERAVCETVEFSKSVQVALDWVVEHPDTLIIVTADHETGGLKIKEDNGPCHFPTVSWATKSHTKTRVNVYACGPFAEQISGTMNNTDFFGIVTGHNQQPGASAPQPDPSIQNPKIEKQKHI